MDELVVNVKRVCRITWTDDETEAAILSIVENAISHLHHKFGMSGEPSPDIFKEPGTERMLFENYCLYCWNNIPEEFEPNYKRDILTVRHKYEVEAARNETENTDV